MDKDELLSIIDVLSNNAIGSFESSISQDRADAIDRYLGRPYGDEMDGRSTVVSKDISETVDWIMPAIMEVFFSSGNIVDFRPFGPEDIEAAQQESDYVNYVMLQENNAFLYIHDWVKDSLILRDGYVKVYPEEVEIFNVEKFSGLTEDEVLMLMDKGYELLGKDERQIIIDEQTVTVYDLKCRITEKQVKIKIEAVPVEEIRVSRKTRGSLDDAALVEHYTVKTRSELIEMGMDREFVEGLPAASDQTGAESSSRDRYSESTGAEGIDPSMEEIEYRECCVRVDFDGDGRAELRKVVIVGSEIPDGDEWNEEIEFQYFCHVTPKRLPHRHIGESLYDELQGLQLLKTIFERAMVDNVLGLVNMEYAINERANMEDFLVTRPIGIKRITGSQPIADSY